jgi:hypothetical protein
MIGIIQYLVCIAKYCLVLILFNILVGCGKVLSDIVGMVWYLEGPKKHLDNLILNSDFLVLCCLGI